MHILREFYGKTTINECDSSEMENSNIDLEYYATKNSRIRSNKGNIYGLGIVKSQNQNGITNVEKQELNNLFQDEISMYQFLEILFKNKVTPIAVEDVLEDYTFSYKNENIYL